MKASIQSVILALILSVVSSACATSSAFNAKIETWKGQSADVLVQAWGQPDAIESLHTGNKMYVYARLKHDPIAYMDFEKKSAANTAFVKPRNPASTDTGIYIKCSTYFEINRQNMIESIMFRGDECR
jgi:hypothetical protein